MGHLILPAGRRAAGPAAPSEGQRKGGARLPGAVQLVYDNYNALVIGFGPSERASEASFSIVLYPRWVTLFFLQGAGLPDPRRLLKGSGKVVRDCQAPCSWCMTTTTRW